MGVYIPKMEIPKEPDEMIEIAIFGDGQVVQTGESWRCIENGKCYYTITNPEKFFNAVSVPPHGRLIDADALQNRIRKCKREDTMTPHNLMVYREFLFAPTIIPADGGET